MTSLSSLPKFTIFTGPAIRDTLKVGDWNKVSHKGWDTKKLLDMAIAQGDWVCLRRGRQGPSKPSLWVRIR